MSISPTFNPNNGVNQASAYHSEPSLMDHLEMLLEENPDPNALESSGHLKEKQNEVNPCLSHPYCPTNDQTLIDLFQKNAPGQIDPESVQSPDKIFYCLRDVFGKHFSVLPLKDLIAFSKTSQCCYLATKSDVLWQRQLSKLLPNAKILSSIQCSVSSEQQFRIISKKIDKTLKACIDQQKKIRDQNTHWKTIEHPKTLETFKRLGGQVAVRDYASRAETSHPDSEEFEGCLIEIQQGPLFYHSTRLAMIEAFCTALKIQANKLTKFINDNLVQKAFDSQIEFETAIKEAGCLIPPISHHNFEKR